MNLLAYWGLALFALMVGWTLQSPLAFGFAVVLGVVALCAAATSRAVPESLTVRREVERTLTPAGSTVLHRVRASARGAFRLRWLVLKDTCPEGVTPLGATGLFTVGVPQAGAEWVYRTELPRRGIYRFGPVQARSGDLFGVGASDVNAEGTVEIHVHPRVVPMTGSNWPSYRPFGDLRADRTVFEDPTRPSGTREYMLGDPLRRIHWSASARAGRLIAKEYDGSRVPLAILLVDRNPAHYATPDDYELAFTAAASLLAQGMGEGYDLGLALETRLMPDRGQAHLEKALLQLAAATATQGSLAQQVTEIYGRIPWLATLLIVTGRLDPADATALDMFRRAGHATVVLLVGSEARSASTATAIGAGCTAFGRIRNEEELATLCFTDVRS